jgi:hypothetical protein
MAPPRLRSPSCAQAGSPSAMPPLRMIYGKGDASVDSGLNRSWRLVPLHGPYLFSEAISFLLLNRIGQRSTLCLGYQKAQIYSAPGSRVPSKGASRRLNPRMVAAGSPGLPFSAKAAQEG